MFKRGRDWAYELLSARKFENDRERSLYLMLLLANGFGAVAHLFLLVIFWWGGNGVMAAINLAGMAVYAANTLPCRQGRFTLCGVVLTVETVVYLTAVTVSIGFGYYTVIYIFLSLVLQFTIPFSESRRLSAALVALLFAALNGNMLLGTLLHPDTVNTLHLTLTLFNINICFLGLVIELTFGNFLKGVMDRYHQTRLRALEGQANTDPLTKLYNRRYADAVFEEYRFDERECCVALLDIDNFKQVNDVHGHASGDLVLQRVAALMRETLRGSDLLFRWGGEEFLVLLRHADLNAARPVVEALRRAVMEEPVPVEDGEIRVTVTIGLHQLEPGQAAACIEACDQKLYHGKKNGKNQVVADWERAGYGGEAAQQ